MSALAAITLSPQTFLAIVAASAVAGTLSATVRVRGLGVPSVVIELVLGVVIGPHVLGLHVTQFTQFFSYLGLGLLFYFAGYEIDLKRISGEPLRLALLGWGLSLAIVCWIGAPALMRIPRIGKISVESAAAPTALEEA
jgi:Kef-type K+ transport system membrane component KefB